MRFHHIGYAVKDIRKYLDDFLIPMFAPERITDPVSDPVQRVTVCFAEMRGGTTIELVEPLGENSPVDAIIGSSRGGVYHLCFEADDLDAELALALEHAHAQGWFSVVIVFHCFEFVRVAELGRPGGRVGPQRLLARRFERLCRYLSRHRDRFQTSSFAELGSVPATPMGQSPARSNRVRTLTRQASQLLSRVL